MAKTFLIGIEPPELPWLRVLVALLRHPDPAVPELARQALVYLADTAGHREPFRPEIPQQPYVSAGRGGSNLHTLVRPVPYG
jgi:hypothetical protein